MIDLVEFLKIQVYFNYFVIKHYVVMLIVVLLRVGANLYHLKEEVVKLMKVKLVLLKEVEVQF
jgi:hypothetical protein